MDGKGSNRSADLCTCPFPFCFRLSLPFLLSILALLYLPSLSPPAIIIIIIINLVPHVDLSVLVLSVPSVLTVLVLSAAQW